MNSPQMERSRKLYHKFVAVCVPLIKIHNQLAIKTFMWKKFNHAKKIYTSSIEFYNMLIDKVEELKATRKSVYVHIHEVCNILKAYEAREKKKRKPQHKKKKNEENTVSSHSHPTTSGNNSETSQGFVNEDTTISCTQPEISDEDTKVKHEAKRKRKNSNADDDVCDAKVRAVEKKDVLESIDAEACAKKTVSDSVVSEPQVISVSSATEDKVNISVKLQNDSNSENIVPDSHEEHITSRLGSAVEDDKINEKMVDPDQSEKTEDDENVSSMTADQDVDEPMDTSSSDDTIEKTDSSDKLSEESDLHKCDADKEKIDDELKVTAGPSDQTNENKNIKNVEADEDEILAKEETLSLSLGAEQKLLEIPEEDCSEPGLIEDKMELQPDEDEAKLLSDSPEGKSSKSGSVKKSSKVSSPQPCGETITESSDGEAASINKEVAALSKEVEIRDNIPKPSASETETDTRSVKSTIKKRKIIPTLVNDNNSASDKSDVPLKNKTANLNKECTESSNDSGDDVSKSSTSDNKEDMKNVKKRRIVPTSVGDAVSTSEQPSVQVSEKVPGLNKEEAESKDQTDVLKSSTSESKADMKNVNQRKIVPTSVSDAGSTSEQPNVQVSEKVPGLNKEEAESRDKTDILKSSTSESKSDMKNVKKRKIVPTSVGDAGSTSEQSNVQVSEKVPGLNKEVAESQDKTGVLKSSTSESKSDTCMKNVKKHKIVPTSVFSDTTSVSEQVHPPKISETSSGETSVQESGPRVHVTEKQKKASARQIRRLEGLLNDVSREIKRLEEKEISLEEMEDGDTDHLQEHKLKKKFMQIYKKICELKESPVETGRIVEKKVHFEGTRFQEVNRKIEKFVNKHGFPDFHDVLCIVKKVNKRNNMNMKPQLIHDISTDAFRTVGNLLQRRRESDFVLNFGSHLTDSYTREKDPALVDKTLQDKLKINRQMGKQRLEDVLEKYKNKQYEMELTGQLDEDDGSDTEDPLGKKDCEGKEEEEEEMEEKEEVLEILEDDNDEENEGGENENPEEVESMNAEFENEDDSDQSIQEIGWTEFVNEELENNFGADSVKVDPSSSSKDSKMAVNVIPVHHVPKVSKSPKLPKTVKLSTLSEKSRQNLFCKSKAEVVLGKLDWKAISQTAKKSATNIVGGVVVKNECEIDEADSPQTPVSTRSSSRSPTDNVTSNPRKSQDTKISTSEAVPQRVTRNTARKSIQNLPEIIVISDGDE
uniref:Death domain-associated protein 6 n=1 Tax=Saccoglossus kowalevskii TaxID=10224 RepID=A0ABM0GRA5_SACKO|nr:PREDICTED: titin-like [Saccoglossus kowalevskii]